MILLAIGLGIVLLAGSMIAKRNRYASVSVSGILLRALIGFGVLVGLSFLTRGFSYRWVEQAAQVNVQKLYAEPAPDSEQSEPTLRWEAIPREELAEDWHLDEQFQRSRATLREYKVYHVTRLVMMTTVGLVILGLLLIGRGGTRTFVLRAVKLLAVGAIVFVVVDFFADPPRKTEYPERQSATVQVDPARIKRSEQAAQPMPQPAGEIPVAIELAKADLAQTTPATVEKQIETAKSKDGESAETATGEKSEASPKLPLPMPFVASEERPDWVEKPGKLQRGVYSVSVSSGPWSSVPECQRMLEEHVQQAADEYINEYLGDDEAASLVHLSPDYVRKVIRRDDFSEVMQSSVGPMHQMHAKLEFNDQARADFQRLWRNAVVRDRLWYTVGGSALVLALLATFYGYLKLDLKTGVAQRGRLQLAATLVALVVAASVLLFRWAVPF